MIRYWIPVNETPAIEGEYVVTEEGVGRFIGHFVGGEWTVDNENDVRPTHWCLIPDWADSKSKSEEGK